MSTKLSYSAAEKRHIIEQHLQGKASRQDIARCYGIDKKTVRDWFRLYQTFGMEGLSHQKQRTRYSPEWQRMAASIAVRWALLGDLQERDVLPQEI